MIRRLIILLLIVGCVFGDTITYNQGNNKRTIENVKFTRAGNGKVYFTAFGRETSRYCNRILEFTDDDGNPIGYDCNAVIVEESLIELEKKIENTISAEDVKSIIKKTKKPIVGGILIAIGGGLLFSVSESECDDCDTIEKTNEFADEVKSSSQLGYLMITLGGILVALGI